MPFDPTEDEERALAAELKRTIDADRYPLSQRIQTLHGILDKLEPPPAREPLPPIRAPLTHPRAPGKAVGPLP
jgi:hypothetical protein